ncbi:protein of unknown function [Paraburkholderia kururiensis]
MSIELIHATPAWRPVSGWREGRFAASPTGMGVFESLDVSGLFPRSGVYVCVLVFFCRGYTTIQSGAGRRRASGCEEGVARPGARQTNG